MALIGRIYAPDVAVLPIGDHFTMGPREAAVAAELVGASRVVPSHYATFPLLTGTPDALRELLPAGVELVAPAPGETRRAVTRRERWFGRTGRKVPEIALAGTVDLTGARSSSTASAMSRRCAGRTQTGSPSSSARAPPRRSTAALARPEVSCVLVADEALLGARSRRSHLWLRARRRCSSRRTRSAPAISMRASGASPRSRSSSPSGRLFRGRHPGWARSRPRPTPTPVTGPRGSICSGAVARPPRWSNASRRPTTAATSGSSVSSTLPGSGATFTGADCHTWAGGRAGAGFAAQGNILVSARNGRRARGRRSRHPPDGRSASG